MTSKPVNGKLRDELLDGEIFYTLRQAKIMIEKWRRHESLRKIKWSKVLGEGHTGTSRNCSAEMAKIAKEPAICVSAPRCYMKRMEPPLRS